MEPPPDLGKVLRERALRPRLLPVYPQVVEGLAGQVDDLRLRHHVQSELAVDEAGAGLRHVALVGDEAGASEAAGAAQPVHPLHPLGVQPAVGLLVLGLEHADDLAVGVLDEVAAAAALVDALRVDAGLDGGLGLPNQLRELGII